MALSLCLRVRLLQVLLALPNVTMEILSSFQATLAVTLADKEQRGLVKKLLMSSGARHATLVPKTQTPSCEID